MAGTAAFPPSSHFNSPPPPPQSSNGLPTGSPPNSLFSMADLNGQAFPPLPNHSAQQHQQQRDQLPAEYRRPSSHGKPSNNGAMTVPHSSHHRPSHSSNRSINAIHPIDGPRSPPNSKNTSHVPCKFFRQGTCQAGKACPFSHATDITTELQPCKYFAKGNCKFGHKCALAHILPDGRRVNRHTMPPMSGGHLNLGGRIIPDSFQHQQSALASSLLHADRSTSRGYSSQYLFSNNGDDYHQSSTRIHHGNRELDQLSKLNTPFPLDADQAYGSPREDGRAALSPNHLTALDAPMPASFDSNGISWNARYGPAAASVPSKFGLESPPHSYSRQFGLPSRTLKSLYNSAFGGAAVSDHAVPQNPQLSSSPSAGMAADGTNPTLVPLHNRRLLKPVAMSSSMPRQMPRHLSSPTAEWDDEPDTTHFTFEEDLVPNSLHELLTDQEKQRRFSRNEADAEASRRAFRNGISSSPSNVPIGSPSTAAGTSPSRFGPLFARQQRVPLNVRGADDDALPFTSNGAGGSSAFGHVGSPLRHSSLMSQHVSSFGGNINGHAAANGTTDSTHQSAHNLGSSPLAVGMISQQLQKTHISKTSAGNELAANTSNAAEPARYPTMLNGAPAAQNGGRLEHRALSNSSSTVASGMGPKGPGQGADEEKEEFVFRME